MFTPDEFSTLHEALHLLITSAQRAQKRGSQQIRDVWNLHEKQYKALEVKLTMLETDLAKRK